MSTLTHILDDLVARLTAESWFADVTVIREDKGDPIAALTTALAPVAGAGGKSGAAVIVSVESATSGGGAEAGPYFNRVVVSIRCVEHLILNRDATAGTGKSALAIAEQVAATLANEEPEAGEQPLFIEAIRALPVDPDTQVLGYEVQVVSAFGLARPGEEDT